MHATQKNSTLCLGGNMSSKTFFWTSIVIGYIVSFVATIILSFFSTKIFGMDWNWGLAMFLTIVFYTMASFKTIGPSEIGAVYCFGTPMHDSKPGLVFCPLFISTLEVESAVLIPIKLSAPILFGGTRRESGDVADNPLNNIMVQKVDFMVNYRVESLILYREKIGTREAAELQIGSLAITVATREFAGKTPADALTELTNHSETLKNEIDAMVAGWGIDVPTAMIKQFNLDEGIIKSMSTAAEAREKAKVSIIDAEAKKTAQILDGEGKGKAEQAIIDGRTAGLKKMMTDLELNGSAVLAAETARGITSNPGQKTIIAGSQGFSDLASAGAVLGETFKSDGGQK